MSALVVRTVNCPPLTLPRLRAALAARDMVLADEGNPDADMIVMWVEADAGAAARCDQGRMLPLVVVGTADSPAAIEAASRSGADAYVGSEDPERLAATCLLVAQSTARFAQVSPLTGLPGNNALQREIERRLPERGELAILAFDVDEFKGYNDRYGYQRGDGLLRYLQAVLLQALNERAGAGWFAAHIGGDDFVALVRPLEAPGVARRAIALFEAGVGSLYDPEDATRGCITVKTRRSEVRGLPLATLTVAAVTNEPTDLIHAGQLASVLTELKAYGKSLPGSVYVPDRRRDHVATAGHPRRRAGVAAGTGPCITGGPSGRVEMAKILFVDDERDLVSCAQVFFSESGYEFVGAYDGMQAIQKVREERPDLICLDVTMPRLTGWDVLQVLQDDPETADIPVLMLTAKTQDQDKARGWELGCTWYHTKPFDFDELLVVVQRILAATEF